MEKERHRKKMIAPMIIAAVIVLYYLGFAFALCIVEMPILVRIIAFVLPLLLSGICISMLIERIKEIRSGEEDDLSKY